MSGTDRRDVPLLSGRRLKRQGINIPHRVSPAKQRFAGLSLVENQDQTQQLSAGKAERKSETRLDGEASSKQLRDQHRSTLAAEADLCSCPGSMNSFPARVVGVVRGRSGFRGGLLFLKKHFVLNYDSFQFSAYLTFIPNCSMTTVLPHLLKIRQLRQKGSNYPRHPRKMKLKSMP